jgi:iron(III) transport system substrate-binding protein
MSVRAAWLPTLVLTVGLLLLACAPATTVPAAPAAAPPPAMTPLAAAPTAPPLAAQAGSSAAIAPPPDWQARWDQTLAAARQEGSLNLVIQTGDLYRKWASEFEQAHPGIKLEVTGLPGRDVVPRVLAERRAEQYLWDVYVGGPNSPQTGLKRADALDPLLPVLLLPEILDDSKWLGGFATGFTDVEGKYVYAHRAEVARGIYVNRDYVPESALSRIEDLTDPRWRGRISWQDPREEGTGSVDAGHMLMLAGEDWLRALLAQEPVVTRDQRQQVDWLVRGRYPIAISPAREAVQAYQAEGLGQNLRPLAPDSALGTRLSFAMAVALFNRAPHPNAATVFINWALSREGQAAWVRNLVSQNSRRLDVPGPPESAPDPQATYAAPLNKEEFSSYLDRAKAIATEMVR